MTELSPESANILNKNTIHYLHRIQNGIPHFSPVLLSYYALKFRVLQREMNISVKETLMRCPRCCLKLQENNPSYAIKPKKKYKFMQKVLRKIKRKEGLTKFQLKYLKKIKPKGGTHNQLVITCNFCKKEVICKLPKPKKCHVDVNANKRTQNTHNNNKRKQKKKKDPYCGLQKEAVVSTQFQKNENQTLTKSQGKTIKNKVLQRKDKKVEKKNLQKLKKTLNQLTSLKPDNSLNKFLQSLKN